MARAATEGELAKLRGDGQACELFMAILNPAVVLACRVNQSFTSLDKVAQVTFDSVTSGAYGNVLAGMTCWVGSAAGLYDKGMVRIRKAATSSVLYIGMTSEIRWEDNLYLTVVDDFGIWAKHASQYGGILMMDYDVAYTDQNESFYPTPVMGPDAVLWLSGATVDFEPDGGDSWVPGGSISGYSWSAPGASATSGLTTATPTITYNAAGAYRVSLTVTANGVTVTGHRNVFVFDYPPSTSSGGEATAGYAVFVDDFTLEDCSGDYERGGWSYTVRLVDDAAISPSTGSGCVRPRAKAVLFARDFYTSTGSAVEESIGPEAGYENVVAMGWIAGESILKDPLDGSVTFRVEGAAHWLDIGNGFAASFRPVISAGNWNRIDGLTVDRAIHHILTWRSTASSVIDCRLSGDAKLVKVLDAASGSVWKQLEEFAGRILAAPCCDRYSRLYVELNQQVILPASRSGIPVVMDLADGDWDGDEGIELDFFPDATGQSSGAAGGSDQGAGMVEITGIYYDGTTEIPLMSRAPGNVFNRFGEMEVFDNLVLSGQAGANQESGLLLAAMNLQIPSITIPLAMNNRLIDICPVQYLRISLAAGDTPRGITLTNQVIIPRRIEYAHDTETTTMQLTVEAEGESDYQGTGVTVAIPTQPTTNIPGQPGIENPEIGEIEFPEFPISPINPYFPFPEPEYGLPDPDPTPEEEGEDCVNDLEAPPNGPWDLHLTGLLDSTEEAHSFNGRYHYDAYIRDGDATYPTRFEIIGQFTKYNADSGEWEDTLDNDFYEVFTLDYNSDPLTYAVNDAVNESQPWLRTGTWTQENAESTYGFGIRINGNDFAPESVEFNLTEADSKPFTLIDDGVKSATVGNGWATVSWSGLTIKGKWLRPKLWFTFPGNDYKDSIFNFDYEATGESESGINTGFYYTEFQTNDVVLKHTDISPATLTFSHEGTNESVVHGETGFSVIAEIGRTAEPYVWSPELELTVYAQFRIQRGAMYRMFLQGVYIYNICGRDE